MKNSYLLSALILLSIHTQSAQANGSTSDWQVIPVSPEMDIIDDNGNPQTINPACAFDYVANPSGGLPLDNSFHFYFKQGKSQNLVVYFNGGGACWDDATCVASLGLANVPGGRAAYNPSILQQNSPQAAGGIFDESNNKNPFKNWSKVFIPYCSGDIHLGSSEVAYSDVDGSITGYPGAPVVVKHHGFDNFMAVREWLKNNFAAEQDKVEKLLVTGSSAGGYGATLNFPYLQSVFPESQTSVFADASEAIVTAGFIDNVFSFGHNWNLEQTLAPLFRDILGAYTADGFNVQIFSLVTGAYPNNRFAQYTTAYDAVQVQFLKIMDQLEQGNTNPYTWGLTEADFLYFYEWNYRMESSLDYLANTTDNYQYYIGAGNVHTVLTDAFATESAPHPFYDESSANGVQFTKWLKRFAKSDVFYQENVKYSD